MLYFMRVPKTGSLAMTKLINQYLKINNNFDVYFRPPHYVNEAFLDAYKQEAFIHESLRHDNGKEYVFIGNHENYIDNASFGYEKPIFISLIRDPVEKVISWFYYFRSSLFMPKNKTFFLNLIEKKGGETYWRAKTLDECVKNGDKECRYIPMNPPKMQGYKRQMLQFCGNYEACWKFGSPVAVKMAKNNVERNFAVVGSWEDTEITLTVLEHYIPRYFKGALQTYKENIKEISETNKNNQKPPVSMEVKAIMYKNFSGELEFYNFCKQRLYKQYLAIKNLNNL